MGEGACGQEPTTAQGGKVFCKTQEKLKVGKDTAERRRAQGVNVAILPDVGFLRTGSSSSGSHLLGWAVQPPSSAALPRCFLWGGPDDCKRGWLTFQGQQAGNSGDPAAALSPRSLGNTAPGNCIRPPGDGGWGGGGGMGGVRHILSRFQLLC